MSKERMNDIAAMRFARETFGKMAVALRRPLKATNRMEYRIGVAKDALTYDVKGLSTKSWEEAFLKAGVSSIPHKVYHPRYQLTPQPKVA